MQLLTFSQQYHIFPSLKSLVCLVGCCFSFLLTHSAMCTIIISNKTFHLIKTKDLSQFSSVYFSSFTALKVHKKIIQQSLMDLKSLIKLKTHWFLLLRWDFSHITLNIIFCLFGYLMSIFHCFDNDKMIIIITDCIFTIFSYKMVKTTSLFCVSSSQFNMGENFTLKFHFKSQRCWCVLQ